MNQSVSRCPCGSNKAFAACCEPYLSGAAIAPTAEALMRSRYSAYTQGDEAYLRATWHRSTCPADEIVHGGGKWLGLSVRACHAQGDEATVEFVARYKDAGRAQRMHEVSRFLREGGKWFYVDGIFPEKSN